MNSSVLIQKNVADFSLLAMTIPLSLQQPYLSFTTAVQRADSAGARCWVSADQTRETAGSARNKTELHLKASIAFRVALYLRVAYQLHQL